MPSHLSRAHVVAAALFTIATTGCSAASAPSSEPTSASREPTRVGTHGGILPRLPSRPSVSASTVPDNGDVNPYGVAFVPEGFPSGGPLHAGDVLISNFNNGANLQGTGTTVVRVNADASPTLFFQDDGAPGLSTALGVLRRGFVLVGNLPSADGSGACAGQESNVGQGGILVLDLHGNLVSTLASASMLDGPWDMAVLDEGWAAHVFVSNALSGTVTRLDLRVGERDDDREERRAAHVAVAGETQIASGYAHRCDPAAFVVGPTGLALDRESGVLYVASTGDNAIFAVEDAIGTSRDRGMGRPVIQDATHLHGPLGLVRASNGDLITSQGDAVNADPAQPSEIVEFTREGRFVAQFSIDPSPGAAFGMALVQREDGFRFAAVDDGLNVLDIWDVR